MLRTMSATPGRRCWSTRLARSTFAIVVAVLCVGDALAANPCLLAEGGISGTGAAPTGEGLGGTGIRSERRGGDDSGIGGTGATQDLLALRAGDPDEDESGIGGTGLVGTITGFGSICVNGIEVHYDSDTPVDRDGQPVGAADLALGQVVRVEAHGRGAEVRARRISVRNEVVGPVSAIDAARGEINVLGQTVKLPSQAVLHDRVRGLRITASELHSGDFVRVSGLRRGDGAIVASRVDRGATQEEVRVSGPVTRVAASAFEVFGVRVTPAEDRQPVAEGRRVEVTGRWDGTKLVPSGVRVEPEVPFSGRFPRISLEGYVQSSLGRRGFRLRGLEVDLSEIRAAGAGEIEELTRDVHVRVRGRLSPDRRIIAERLEIEDARSGRSRWKTIQRDAHSGARDDRDDREEREDREDRAERSDRVERSDRSERSERPERPARAERPQRSERPERPERPERSER